MKGRLSGFRGWFLPSIALGFLGLLGNWFKLELFFNVDFLFGSIFVMLAAQWLGVRGALVAGLIAGSGTVLLWHHPWALVIGVLEAGGVAALVRSRRYSLVNVDILFWSLCGAPLVWAFYRGFLGVEQHSVVLLMLKQAINGIFNSLLAAWICLALRFRFGPGRSSKLPSFRQLIFMVMMSLVLVPALLLIGFRVRLIYAEEQARLVTSAERMSDVGTGLLKQWMQDQFHHVAALAESIDRPDKDRRDRMQMHVELLHRGSPYFERMGIFDAKYISVAYSPAVDREGRSTIGLDISDRSWLPPRNNLRPTLSDVFVGKIGTSSPIVVFNVPVVRNGTFQGFCAGVVQQKRLSQFMETILLGSGADLTLVDRAGKVIVSTNRDRKVMDHFSTVDQGTRSIVSDRVYLWTPTAALPANTIERWRNSKFVREEHLDADRGWTIVTESSAAPLVDALTRATLRGTVILSLLIALAALLAGVLSRTLVDPLQKLQMATREIPVGMLQGREPELPSSRISELDALVENFRSMIVALQEAFAGQRRHLEEKSMMIKDVHDGIGGIVANIAMIGRYGLAQKEGGRERESLVQIVDLAVEGSGEIRSFMNSAESGDVAWGDLLLEIKDFSDKMLASNGIRVSVETRNLTEAQNEILALGSFRYLNILRIVKEAITNVLRHASAGNVRVECVRESGKIVISIADDGIGFDPEKVRRRGVANMVARAQKVGATLTITREAGTTVRLEVPV